MPTSTRASFPAGAGVFLTTRWSVVLSARGDDSDATAALAKLCQIYWYPLYAYIRRQGFSAHDAQDLTQEFFARLLAKDWLARVARDRGRFRSWLLASLKHFLANEWDRARTQKRGGDLTLLPLDAMSAETRYCHEPADAVTAEILYDRRWALTLLDQVLARLREEMATAGKLPLFEALKSSLTRESPAYAEIALQLGISEGAVKVAAHRLRGRYRVLIRREIAETVADPSEVESELQHLFAALSR